MHTSRDNYALGPALLATGTAGSVSIGLAVGFQIAGRAYSKAATANIPLVLKTEVPALAATNLGNSQVSVFFIFIDASGTVVYRQGPVKTHSTGPGYVPGAFEWPADEPLHACLGAVKVATSAAQTFIPGTTVFGTANTATFYNVADDLGVPIPY